MTFQPCPRRRHDGSSSPMLFGSLCFVSSLVVSRFVPCFEIIDGPSPVVHRRHFLALLARRRCGSLESQNTCEVVVSLTAGRDSHMYTHIMIFHVSTGRSASLKDQSNFSSATGSSVGSWYGDKYSCARPAPAFIRFRGSKTSICSRRSTASDG